MEPSRINNSVYHVAARSVSMLSKTLDTSSGKATMAAIRNSIGKPLSETIEIWPLVFENLPEEFLSATGRVTDQEKSILTALQFYALHQQGKNEDVSNLKTDKWDNIGTSLSNLRQQDSVSMDRRFNAMITSSSYEELIQHLRQLIKLLKSKTQAKVNYAKLADDLFWFLRGSQENVRIRWAQSYYRYNSKNNEGENENVN